MQTTSHALMIRPSAFGFNSETASSNSFQFQPQQSSDAQAKALAEFNNFTSALAEAGVNLLIVDDTAEPQKPDAIFPNNWFSTHRNGKLITYPMFSSTRRTERRDDLIITLTTKFGYAKCALESYEAQQKFLEGTGSLVLDHQNKLAYMCESIRSQPEPLQDFCKLTGYKSITFKAHYENTAIYHTNVMMSIGESFVVICLNSITDAEQKKEVLQSLKSSGREIINVTLEQMVLFSCNVLELQNQNNNGVLAMSECAFQAFTQTQQQSLAKHAHIVHCPLPTIESIGGGSARCMIAEIFLPSE